MVEHLSGAEEGSHVLHTPSLLPPASSSSAAVSGEGRGRGVAMTQLGRLPVVEGEGKDGVPPRLQEARAGHEALYLAATLDGAGHGERDGVH